MPRITRSTSDAEKAKSTSKTSTAEATATNDTHQKPRVTRGNGAAAPKRPPTRGKRTAGVKNASDALACAFGPTNFGPIIDNKSSLVLPTLPPTQIQQLEQLNLELMQRFDVIVKAFKEQV